MKPVQLFTCIVALIISLSNLALAGDIQTDIVLLGDGTVPAAAEVVVSGDPQVLSLAKRPGGWRYNFANTAEPITRLQVQVNGVPAGVYSSTYNVDLPFYYDEKPLKLSGVLLNESVGDSELQGIVNSLSGGKWLGSTAKTFQTSERLQHVFAQRYARIKEGVPAIGADIVTAYWIIVAAREMFEKRSIVPTPQVKEASDFLDDMLLKQPGLFRSKTVDDASVKEAQTRLGELENIKYQRLLAQLEPGINNRNSDKRAIACSRVTSLWTMIRNLAEEDYEQAAKGGAIHLRLTTGVALCLTRVALAQSPPQLSSADLETAQRAIEDFNTLIPLSSGAERTNAERGLTEIQTMVPSS